MTPNEEEIGELSHWKVQNFLTLIMSVAAWEPVNYSVYYSWITSLRVIFHFGPHLHCTLVPLTSAVHCSLLWECYSNHLRLPELSNCITVSRSKKATTIKTPAKPRKVKEPKEPKKPATTIKSAESPTSKPKRKKSEKKKATKETDRKILVAVDLWVRVYRQAPTY